MFFVCIFTNDSARFLSDKQNRHRHNMIPRYQKFFSTQRESLYDRVNTIDDEATNEEKINE